MTQPPKDPRLLYGKTVRAKIFKDVKARVKQVTQTHKLGKLVSISIGGKDDAAIYIRGQERAALKVGIPFQTT